MTLTAGDQKDSIAAHRFHTKEEPSFARITAYLTPQYHSHHNDNSYSVQAITYWSPLAQLQDNPQS